MQKIEFSVGAKAARLIGRENIADVDGALIELIKNAYDADASCVWIYFYMPFPDVPTMVDSLDRFVKNLSEDELKFVLDCYETEDDKLKKKAAVLSHADAAGLKDLAVALGGVCADASGIEAAFEADAALVIVEGADALAPALEAADRRTLVVVASASGTAFYGLAVNPKAGIVGRAVNAQDIAVTIATIADLPIDEDCTGAIIYQVMKNPNLKLEEIKKLKEALVRMESVIQRDNREPWDKHDCA